MWPSSIFTGKCTVSSRRGFFRTSSIPPSKFSFFPTRSICSRATSNGLYSCAFAMRTASQYLTDIEGGGEYGRPLLNIVFEVRGRDSQPPPANASVATVPRSRGRIVGRIDDVPRLLAAEEPQYVVQGRLHRGRLLPGDHRRDVWRHHDVGKVLERTMKR